MGLSPLGLSSCDENSRRFASAWRQFKSNHIAATGRVIDNSNGNISHSEGQGFALLLAEAAGDYSSFAKIKAWTDYVLGVRDDSLFAWRFMPFRGRPVPDLNNATDGDILIAWALLRASRRWQKPALAQQANRILRDIERLCVAPATPFGPLIKPGATGFETKQRLVINLSYFVFPALAAFADETGNDIWRQLTASGLELLKKALFGDLSLPADWIDITAKGVIDISKDQPPHYGWNAIRVPLYLAWAKEIPNQPYLAPYQRLLQSSDDAGAVPAWVDLTTGARADFSTSRGGADIYRLVQCQLRSKAVPADSCQSLVTAPTREPAEDYYSSALGLLARLAYFELSPESFNGAPFTKLPDTTEIAESKTM